MADNPYVNKIIHGNQTLIDLTSDTVTPSDVRQGVTFHDKSGESKTGTLEVLQHAAVFDYSGNFVYTWEEIMADRSLIMDNTKEYILAIPDTVTEITNRMFSSCYSIKTLIIPDSITSIGQVPISYVDLDTIISKNKLVWEAGSTQLFIKVKHPYILDGVTKLSDNLFYTNPNLKAIHIPDSVKNIRIQTFQDCVNLEYVHLPNNNEFTKINDQTFMGCSSLRFIEIPNSVTTINARAFKNCTSLDIFIPETVTTIGVSSYQQSEIFLNVPHITYHGTAAGAPWGALSMN